MTVHTPRRRVQQLHRLVVAGGCLSVHNCAMTVTLTWIGWAVGLLAAVLTLYQWVTSRKRRRAEDRAFEILNQQLVAADAKEEVEHYQQLRLDLRRQIEREIPAEARKAYLRNRLEGLAKSIGEDYEEYSKIQRELNAPPRSALDQSIRAVIEQNRLPSGRTHRTRERVLLGLITFLALFSLTPISNIDEVYTKILSEPAAYSGRIFALTVFLSIVFWSIVVGMIFVASPLGRSFGRSRVLSLLTIAATAVAFFILILISYNSWLNLHDNPPFNDSTFVYEYHATYFYVYWLITAAAICAGTLIAEILVKASQMLRAFARKDHAPRSPELDAKMKAGQLPSGRS